MIDLTLRECPFCGNPAEIVDAEPFSFMPNTPTKRIRCSWSMCIGHSINNSYQVDLETSETMARNDWNVRKRKNKLTFNEEYVFVHNKLEQLKEQKNDSTYTNKIYWQDL